MKLEFRENVALAPYTTLGVGGVADYFVTVESIEEVIAVLQFAKQTAAPLLLLGGGSNLLISDEGFRGIVIENKIVGLDYEHIDDSTVRVACAAGENFDNVVGKTVADDLWGLENLSAIPGSVGATPIQNVGAYGVEVSNLIESVSAIHCTTGEQKTFSNDACQFAYRDSFFKSTEGQDWVVVGVAFLLRKNATPTLSYDDLANLDPATVTLQAIRQTVLNIRTQKFPDWTKVGTAGSFFKNPIISNEHYKRLKERYLELPAYVINDKQMKVPLGWILDKVCNMRGYKRGPIRLYENQALVLVAEPGATAREIISFMEEVLTIVYDHTGITIEPEPTIV